MSSHSLFEVNVDFATSHVFFPKIILTLMAMMLLVILFKNLAAIKRFITQEGLISVLFDKGDDRVRFFLCLVITSIYFVSMEYVGSVYPNEGLGFLFCSVPFLIILSLLFAKDLCRRVWITILTCAVIAPLLVWYVLGRLFGIALP